MTRWYISVITNISLASFCRIVRALDAAGKNFTFDVFGEKDIRIYPYDLFSRPSDYVKAIEERVDVGRNWLRVCEEADE